MGLLPLHSKNNIRGGRQFNTHQSTISITMKHTELALFLIIQLHPAYSLVGYDCGGSGLNITTLSLLETGTCQEIDVEPTTTQIYLQLLQLSEFKSTQIKQCKIEIDRTTYYCGMHSHMSIVHNGRQQYIQPTTAEACKRLHDHGNIDLGNNIFLTNIKSNTTQSRSVTLVGTVATDGKCSGAQYSDPFGTWDGVVVQAAIKITLRNYQASIQFTSDEIILSSGQRCSASTGSCVDFEGGDTYWDTIPHDSCNFHRYDVLYDGTANKLIPKEGQNGPTIYTLTTQETTFALAKTSEIKLCGYTLIKTEHPKLFILEVSPNNGFRIKDNIDVNNLDIFTYVNSKFVYVEKHIRNQLSRLYTDIIQQKCTLEKQILQNALTLANIAPDQMATKIMKQNGYTAITAGEVIHIIKCIPVECMLRRTDQCYEDLPVI